MKILLFGGSGLLGTELRKLNHNFLAPTHTNQDLVSFLELDLYIDRIKPDIVINCAAIKDNRKIEQDPADAIATNIIGAGNLAIVCSKQNIRYVYISTDYIYEGSRGNYLESDHILPCNLYAWTKLGGEASAKCVKNHLIIRTSFGKSEFDYKEAFTDKWTSKDYVDVIAPMILEAALSPLTGVLNIGTERKTIYDHATARNTDIKPVKLSESSHSTPYDTSLNLQKWMDYKSINPIAKPHKYCRVCNSDQLIKYLDLGLMPLANNLEFTSKRAKEQDRFPLQVMFCNECSLSQLSVVIDPGKMFSYYTYRSSINAPYVTHCREMAKGLKAKYNLSKDSFMIDIAGNDGALLNEFRDELGIKVLNIDPASNLASISESKGIESIADFWGVDLASKLIKSYGNADLITATNVFAHVDNVKDFIISVKHVLKQKGILVLEFPYLVDFIDNREFDTVYYEHLSYVSILPLNRLCIELDMKIISVEKQQIHGGSVRVIIAKEASELNVDNSVFEFIDKENKAGYSNIDRYKPWSNVIKASIKEFTEKILSLKVMGNKIAAFAASAKGNTLLNSAGINTDIIDYIVDQTPEKIGKFSPGTGIPIVGIHELTKRPPDYLIILSWNFADEIMKKAKEYGFVGKFIVPIPKFEII